MDFGQNHSTTKSTAWPAHEGLKSARGIPVNGATRALDWARRTRENPIMAQFVTIAKQDKRKRLVLPDEFIAEAP